MTSNFPKLIEASWDNLRTSGVDVDNYLGFWCVEPTRFSQVLWQVEKLGLMQHVHASTPRGVDMQSRDYVTTGTNGSVAVIEIAGTMTKKGSSLSEGGSTIRARRAIRQAVNDSSVDAIVLRMDTPGGTVSGTEDLANDVAQAARQKRVVGYVEDLTASAGMWVISQANEIYANSNTAQVGSIGTFMALYDLSGMAEKEGIKPIVIKAGEYKAAGFPGTQITDEQVAKWQAMIDGIQEQFNAAVATGRNMPIGKVQEVATGLTYIASEAVSLGLIDGVRNFDSVIEELQSTPKRSRVAMSEHKATYDEIVSSCHGCDTSNADDALFVADCQKRGLTAIAASAAWSETLTARAESAREELAQAKQQNEQLAAQVGELQAQLAASAAKPKGVEPIGTRTATPEAGASDDPITEWNKRVSDQMNLGKSKADAVKTVAREFPELRAALVAASN